MHFCEVTHVIDVKNFWARLGTEETFIEFHKLQQAVNTYCDDLAVMRCSSAEEGERHSTLLSGVSSEEPSGMAGPSAADCQPADLKEGNMVLVLLQEHGRPAAATIETAGEVWCRALVLRVCRSAKSVDTFLVDFGWSQMVDMDSVIGTCPDWMQSIPAFTGAYSLAGMQLHGADGAWPTSVTEKFVELVKGCRLVAAPAEESGNHYVHASLCLWMERCINGIPTAVEIAKELLTAYTPGDVQSRNVGPDCTTVESQADDRTSSAAADEACRPAEDPHTSVPGTISPVDPLLLEDLKEAIVDEVARPRSARRLLLERLLAALVAAPSSAACSQCRSLSAQRLGELQSGIIGSKCSSSDTDSASPDQVDPARGGMSCSDVSAAAAEDYPVDFGRHDIGIRSCVRQSDDATLCAATAGDDALSAHPAGVTRDWGARPKSNRSYGRAASLKTFCNKLSDSPLSPGRTLEEAAAASLVVGHALSRAPVGVRVASGSATSDQRVAAADAADTEDVQVGPAAEPQDARRMGPFGSPRKCLVCGSLDHMRCGSLTDLFCND